MFLRTIIGTGSRALRAGSGRTQPPQRALGGAPVGAGGQDGERLVRVEPSKQNKDIAILTLARPPVNSLSLPLLQQIAGL